MKSSPNEFRAGKPDRKIETERKYLIRMPDGNMLAALPGVRVLKLEQTYLLSEEGVMSRVRRVEEDGRICFIRTEKRRISPISSYEDEWEIGEAEYFEALREADATCRPIVKTRYTVPHDGLFCEIDIFPFWEDRAILEMELPSEDTAVDLPDYVRILREVSGDRRYSNHAMARQIPQDNIELKRG